MPKKLSMSIALALLASTPNTLQYSDSNYDPYQRKESWQGRGKRKKPKMK